MEHNGPDYNERMDPDVKRKWVEALRSGKYRQGKKFLMTVKNKRASYCCLGVLHKIVLGAKYRPLGTPLAGSFAPPEGVTVYHDPNGSFDIPDLPPAIGKIPKHELANMNDYGKKSFKDIADWIEEEL